MYLPTDKKRRTHPNGFAGQIRRFGRLLSRYEVLIEVHLQHLRITYILPTARQHKICCDKLPVYAVTPTATRIFNCRLCAEVYLLSFRQLLFWTSIIIIKYFYDKVVKSDWCFLYRADRNHTKYANNICDFYFAVNYSRNLNGIIGR